MARGRMLSKSFSTSVKRALLWESLGPPCEHGGSLTEFAHALYPLLVAHADDFGRLAGDTFTVKNQCDPASPRSFSEVERALAAMHDVGLIVWYVAERRRLIQIVDFDAHQIGLHKRTASRFPPPTGHYVDQRNGDRSVSETPDAKNAIEPGRSGNSGNYREFPASRARAELNLTEQNRTKERKYAPPAPTSPHARNGTPNVRQLAAMVLREILPLELGDEGDLVEAAKRRAAQLRLPYTGQAIARAVASARAQLAKGIHTTGGKPK